MKTDHREAIREIAKTDHRVATRETVKTDHRAATRETDPRVRAAIRETVKEDLRVRAVTREIVKEDPRARAVTRETDHRARVVTRETDHRARAATRETDHRVRAATRETDHRVRAVTDTEDHRVRAVIRMTRTAITPVEEDHREHVPAETEHQSLLTLQSRQSLPATELQRTTTRMTGSIREIKKMQAREEQQPRAEKQEKLRFCLQFM